MAQPIARVQVADQLERERGALLERLAGLSADAWKAPTECPAWTVKGVALHILGDDLSLLARQRDEAESGLIPYAMTHPGLDFRALLDGFNEQWVTAATFLSEPLVIELLRLSGEWTARYYLDVDPDAPGEPVGFFGGADPSPFWQAVTREYIERWIHHHQICRATGQPDLDEAYLAPAWRGMAVALGVHLRDCGASPGDVVVVAVDDVAAYTLQRGDDCWKVFDGAHDTAATTVSVGPADAPTVLSRGLTAPDAAARFTITGDESLGRRVVKGIAAFAGRT